MKLSAASFLSLTIFLYSGLAYSQVKGIPQARNAQQEIARDIFRELVDINTTVNMGSTAAAEAMAKQIQKCGIPGKRYQCCRAPASAYEPGCKVSRKRNSTSRFVYRAP